MRLPATVISVFTALVSFSSATPASQLAMSTTDTFGQSVQNGVTIDSLLNVTETSEATLAVTSDESTGQVLGITDEPAVEAEEQATERPVVTVTVAKGDTLSKIAATHQTTYNRLFDANTSISDPNIINPGDAIRIPYADEVIAARALPAPRPVAAAPRATRPSTKPVASTAPAVAGGSVWDQLAQCESGGRWNINTGNGYYGGLQFLPSTWRAVGGSGLPHQNSREEQIYRAEILLSRSGWGQWPQCARKLGLL